MNFRTCQFKRAHEPYCDFPCPTNHGWVKSDSGLEPQWSEGPILPKNLIDLLGNQERDDSESEDSETDENDGKDLTQILTLMAALRKRTKSSEQ